MKTTISAGEKSMLDHLACARQAILAGDFARLATLNEKIEKLMQSFRHNNCLFDAAQLRLIRNAANSNAAIAVAALGGIKAASIERQYGNDEFKQLATYTKGGTISVAVTLQNSSDRRI